MNVVMKFGGTSVADPDAIRRLIAIVGDADRHADGDADRDTDGPPIVYLSETNRPQPALDVDRGRGMTVSIGRLRPCPVLDYKYIALGHNTIRGAAGAAILNAELMHREGLL